MGFVLSCSNNNLCVHKTASAVLHQPNALIHWVFGSIVSGVGDTLASGCPWESCHCPVLRHYAHAGTRFDRWAASLCNRAPKLGITTDPHWSFCKVCPFLWSLLFFTEITAAQQIVPSARFSHKAMFLVPVGERSNCISHWPCFSLIAPHKAERDWTLWNPETPRRQFSESED